MKPVNGYIAADSMTEEGEHAVVHQNAEISPEPPKISENEISPPPSFLAPIKPKGIPPFKLSAIYKSRLRGCFFLQCCLFLILLCRLSEDFLDRCDVFILEIEELYLPKPKFFEYAYFFGHIIFIFMAMRGLSKNSTSLKQYAAATVIFGICPLLIGAIYYFNDILEYAEKKNEAEVAKWMDFPIACYWYGYSLVAIQIHLFSIYFVAKLLKIWRSKIKKN